MTFAQLEHLKLIDAHLARLLDIAEKRTPGEWEHCQQSVWVNNEGSWINCPNLYANAEHNAAFIAAAAGNAEAGWRATRAVIEWLNRRGAMFGLLESEQILLESILAAFPIESLK